MKLYTKRGDDGGTDLYAGGRTSKTDPRIRAIGEVDETNAALGLAVTSCEAEGFKAQLQGLQSRLFDLGADLATVDPVADRRIRQAHVDEMEMAIDAVSDQLPVMKHFILPGGCELAARLHFARTVCRRAERACVVLMQVDASVASGVVYLNRLSDLLFALARLANQQAGVEDVPWKG